MAYVPVIDISQIDHPQDRLRLLTNIKDALENVGFMCIVGHGISEEILQRVEAMSRAFFELPLTTKTRLAKKFFNSQNGNVYKGYFPIQEGPTQSSLKEGFDVGLGCDSRLSQIKGKMSMFWEDNVWPDESILPGFKNCMLSYAEELQKLGRTLLQAIAESLNLPRNYFDPMFASSLSTLRLLRYPENPNRSSDKLSCSEHTDSGALTLLLQDEVGGLQVRDPNGIWHDITPVANSFVINTGDLFERWTGGVFKATMHRVLGTTRQRYSSPFFFEPSGDAVIRCVPGCHPRSEAEKQDIIYAEYLIEKIKKFDEYKQEE